MKEIPILFSTPMVKANLEDRKQMTRRLKGLEQINKDPGKWKAIDVDSPFKPADIFWFEGQGERIAIKCPYGVTGDMLWVRETWLKRVPKCDFGEYGYKADLKHAHLSIKWKPSIHMPKIAARIWLQVTDVRAERLQEITEADAISEGIEPVPSYNSGEGLYPGQKYRNYLPTGYTEVMPKDSFQSLWMKINGNESWAANPWLWVISYKILSKTGKPELTTEKI